MQVVSIEDMKVTASVSGILIGLLFISAGTAQETPLIKNHSPELMQADNQNWSVAQAPSRHIYIGNKAGMVQYDGARWKLLQLPNRQIVRSVAVDAEGRIFCGGFGEFGCWYPAGHGAGHYISLSNSLQMDKVGREEIWHILVTEGKVYFQSFSALYEYDYKSVKELAVPGNIMFMQQVGGRILLPVISKGIFVMSEAGFTLLPGTEMLGEVIVVGMAALAGDRLVIGTDRQGLFVWEKGKLRPWDAAVNKMLSKSRLNKVLPLSNGDIALGTIGEGIYIADSQGSLLHHIYRERGLQNNAVLALYEDMDGNLWAGLDKGLDLVVMNSPLRFSLDRSGSLGAVYTAAFYRGHLYLGTNQGLFYKSIKSGRPGAEAWQPVPGINGQVWELSVVGEALLCGHNDGTFLVEPGRARKISGVTGGWITRPCPWDSTLWIQGTYTGLVVLRSGGRGNVHLAHRIDGFSQPVEYMEFDAEGKLWVAHPYRGLYRIDIQKDAKCVVSVKAMSDADGLPTDFDLSLAAVNGKLLLHAADHFFCWDQGARRWMPHLSEGGFVFNGKEKAMIPESEGFFVVYADRAVYVKNGRQIAYALRLVKDRPHVISLKDSSWLFCLEDGYAICSFSEDYFYSDKNFSPIINQITINGDTPKRSLEPLVGKIMEFEPSENRLAIYYSCMAFDKKPLYRWRMQGLEPQWSEWQETSMQEFSFLPPGEYLFEVQSDISPDTTGYAFRIKPRWYQTWQFRLFSVFAGMGLGFFALYRYRAFLERRHRKLLLDRERQLHQQRIHERNEQLQEDVFKKARDLANSTMQLIRKSELLLEIKQRLAYLGREGRGGQQIGYLTRLVDQELGSENDWALFEENFNSVHEAFLRKMRIAFPDLTPGDLRLAAYLKMNLSSKEIAPLLGISLRGVENKRYRLRRKMNLPNDENLVEFLLDF